MKLPVISGEKLIRVLIKAGFVKVRQRGSHVRLEKIVGNDFSMKIKPIPEGYHSLTPDLVVKDVAEAIEFYKKVFSAKKRRVFHGSDGSIVHADIQIGDSILMLFPEIPEMKVFSPLSPGGGTSASMYLYVENADAVFEKAVSAGSRVTMPIADTFWGDRAGGIVDPFGHSWMGGMRIKYLSDKEIEEASKAMFAR